MTQRPEHLHYDASRRFAAGLPASPDQFGANIRVALALEGPLAIPGLRAKTTGGLTGLNNSQRNSIARDFRSGNANDESADIARGFVRDPLPLRVILALGVLGNIGASAPSQASRFVVTGILLACAVSNRRSR